MASPDPIDMSQALFDVKNKIGYIVINMLDSFIHQDIYALYEVHNYRNAAQILATACPDEFEEIMEGLRAFRLTVSDIRKTGGNESEIPKRISRLLFEKGWRETRIIRGFAYH